MEKLNIDIKKKSDESLVFAHKQEPKTLVEYEDGAIGLVLHEPVQGGYVVLLLTDSNKGQHLEFTHGYRQLQCRIIGHLTGITGEE